MASIFHTRQIHHLFDKLGTGVGAVEERRDAEGVPAQVLGPLGALAQLKHQRLGCVLRPLVFIFIFKFAMIYLI
jgi:hypothetical protein